MNETEGTNTQRERCSAAWEGCHVLMNSRRYGTSVFTCKNVEDAARTLGWLALRAEREQRQDGVQRFFCLLPPISSADESTAPLRDGPDTPESEDVLVVCLAEGALQWIAGDGLQERPLIVLEAVGSEAEGPFVCWQACPRPLRQVAHLHRHAVSRYLHLQRMRQQDEPDRRTTAATAEEGSGLVDPVVSAWQQNQADEKRPLLTLSAVLEAPSADHGEGFSARGGPPMSRKFAVGVTLTAEEKARIGFDSRPNRNRLYTGSQSATSSNLVRSWTCEVQLPDGATCSVAYQRDGPRCHRFSYREPVRERVWHMHPLEGGAYAIEQKAQELAPLAFALAQAAEQKEMRRTTMPSGHRLEPLPAGMERMRVKTARDLGGLYAVCLRFASGNLMPVGMAHPHPDAALAEYESGQHADTLRGSSRYVIGICCRWQRRWIEPQFLTRRLPGGETASAVPAARHKSGAQT